MNILEEKAVPFEGLGNIKLLSSLMMLRLT